ncbi:MAG: NAD-dependent epimerase/dehydratase family protein [Clostridia bacterium]|nr:NAD-dependent epimerase/dehydratase family protein [Clostridia bacterium]
MKKVLIVGTNSYVGTFVRVYLEAAGGFAVTEVGTEHGEWETFDFSPYDVVYHVAGIAHSDFCNLTESETLNYFRVNTDLAIACAEKARNAGVRQFIFMSTSLVYGRAAAIGCSKVITRSSEPAPFNIYGESKFRAEKGVMALRDESFRPLILRCPIIYGKNCKGNFPTMLRYAKLALFFPKIKNERSMLYVGNLAEYLRVAIENGDEGIFWPSNREYSNTSELIRLIRATRGKKTVLVPGFNWLFKLLGRGSNTISKAFGNLTFEEELSRHDPDYRVYSLEQSIEESVN